MGPREYSAPTQSLNGIRPNRTRRVGSSLIRPVRCRRVSCRDTRVTVGYHMMLRPPDSHVAPPTVSRPGETADTPNAPTLSFLAWLLARRILLPDEWAELPPAERDLLGGLPDTGA